MTHPLASPRLRGGTTRLLLWPASGAYADPVDIPGARLPARGASGLTAQADRVDMAGGGRRVQGRTHALEYLVADQRAVERIKALGSTPLRGLALGTPKGAHRLWEEPAPAETDAADAGFGASSGHVVRLYSRVYDAKVELTDDLLHFATNAPAGGVNRWGRALPVASYARGVWLWAYAPAGVHLIALDASGALLAQDQDAALAILYAPPGTRTVRVESAGPRPALRLAPPALAGGAYVLTHDGPGGLQYRGLGQATVTVEADRVTFGPPDLAARRLRFVSTGSTRQGYHVETVRLPDFPVQP